MVEKMKINAYAKINLAIDILGKRENGYHDVEMIMQSIALYDEITLYTNDSGKITLSIDKPLPTDERNIAYKAAKLLFDTYNIAQGIHIDIKKNIPIAAGLAGGSTDAAAVLKGINAIFKLGLSTERLMELGKSLGADVPYCIKGSTMLACGIGEILKALPAMSELSLVLVKPDISVSTKEVYEEFDKLLLKPENRPDISMLVQALENKEIERLAANMKNVLELVTIKKFPVIEDIKKTILRKNSLGCMMSGSGPTVFGLFCNEEDALKCKEEIKLEKYVGKIENIYLTRIYNSKEV